MAREDMRAGVGVCARGVVPCGRRERENAWGVIDYTRILGVMIQALLFIL